MLRVKVCVNIQHFTLFHVHSASRGVLVALRCIALPPLPHPLPPAPCPLSPEP